MTPGSSPNSPAPTSFDGAAWQPLGDFPFAGAFEVTSVTATRSGFAAVGFGAVPGETYFGRRQGIVWTPADGRTWQQSADPALQFVTPEEIVALNDSLYVFGTIQACGLEASGRLRGGARGGLGGLAIDERRRLGAVAAVRRDADRRRSTV